MTPLLRRLADDEAEAWEALFCHVYPPAFEAARLRLRGALQNDCEDVALEALAQLSDQISELESENELKPLAVAMSRNIATDRLRKWLTEKRGGNKVESLEALTDTNSPRLVASVESDALDRLSVKELGGLLAELSSAVGKPHRMILRDHFFEGLSYNEIASKHGIALGSVGVYIQRGVNALKSAIAKRPKLEREFIEILGDARAVKLLLPLISAIQLGGWLVSAVSEAPAMRRRGFPEQRPEDVIVTHEELLQRVQEELPKEARLSEQQTVRLIAYVFRLQPGRYGAWIKRRQELRAKQNAMWEANETTQREWRKAAKRKSLIVLTVAFAIGAVVIYALSR